MSAPTAPTRQKWGLVGLAFAAAAAGGAASWHWLGAPREVVVPVTRAAPCDLTEAPCRISLPGGRIVELDVVSRPIVALAPFQLRARFLGGHASGVRWTATGDGMDMGASTVALEADGDAGAFSGRSILPICATDIMRWRGRLDFELDGVPGGAVVRFTSIRSRPPLDGGGVASGVERVDGPMVDFTLQSAKGPMRLSDFRGKVVLVYFGYTFCPDICPTSLTATARALRRLSPQALEQVQTLFVSVDPARDTPEHLAEYAAFFHPSIIGVTGTEAAVAEAARPFGVVYARHEVPGAGGYVVDHSALTYLVDPTGRLVATLPHAAAPEVILAELSQWLPNSQ